MRQGVYVSLIAAVAENGVIGAEGDLPWHLPRDLKWFKQTTRGHAVVMGRKTFDSLGGKPLPQRVNIVLTRDEHYQAPGAEVMHTWDATLQKAASAEKASGGSELFILGGEQIYRLAMNEADRLYITRVHGTFTGDACFPEMDKDVWQKTFSESHDTDEKHAYAFTFEKYERADSA